MMSRGARRAWSRILMAETWRTTWRVTGYVDMYCRLIVVLWCVYTAAFTTTGIVNRVPFRSTRRIVGVDKVCFIDNSRSPIRQSCGIQIDMLGGWNFIISFVAELARVSCTSPFSLKGLKFDGMRITSNGCQSGLLLSSNSLLS